MCVRVCEGVREGLNAAAHPCAQETEHVRAALTAKCACVCWPSSAKPVTLPALPSTRLHYFTHPPPLLSSLQGHFKLVNHELQRLRQGFAIASVITGRALVVPELWAGLDRWWAPHSGERLAGWRAGWALVWLGSRGVYVRDGAEEDRDMVPAWHARELTGCVRHCQA